LPANVEIGSPDSSVRGRGLLQVVRAVIDDLDDDDTGSHATRFLVHLAWHEAAACTARAQHGGGPARGLPQFEAHRARDTLEYAFRRRNDRVFWRHAVSAARTTEPAITDASLEAAWRALPEFGDPQASRFPQGSVVERLLLSNDYFALTCARIALKKLPAALPHAAEADLDYWARHWKVTNVSAADRANFEQARAAIDQVLGWTPTTTDGVLGASPDEPAWLTAARDELGVEESAGRESTPRINTYLASVGIEPADEHAWCSAFVNWVMVQNGFVGTGRGNARSWARWGEATEPRAGAIAVLWRESKSSWKGHVGFLVSISSKEILLLGGNQDDRVCLKSYPRDRLLALRWPSPTEHVRAPGDNEPTRACAPMRAPSRGVVVPLTRAQIVQRALYLSGRVDIDTLDEYVRKEGRPSMCPEIYYLLQNHNGGKDPTASDPADYWIKPGSSFVNRTADCSGGNSWMHGFDRFQPNRMHSTVGYGGWFNTDSKIIDACGPATCFRSVGRPEPGTIIVCRSGSPGHKIGHEGTVVAYHGDLDAWDPKIAANWKLIDVVDIASNGHGARANTLHTGRGWYGTDALFLTSIMEP
jgi:uncharacterized protein (TIGR02594 family)